jgi:hypothetical protein
MHRFRHFVTFTGPRGANISPLAIGSSGRVVGTFVDSSGASHGFLRSADGKTVIQIDAPRSTPQVRRRSV